MHRDGDEDEMTAIKETHFIQLNTRSLSLLLCTPSEMDAAFQHYVQQYGGGHSTVEGCP